MRRQAPLQRLAGVPGLDAGMGVDAPHGFEVRAHRLRELGDLLLPDAKLGICRGNRENLDVETHARLSSRCVEPMGKLPDRAPAPPFAPCATPRMARSMSSPQSRNLARNERLVSRFRRLYHFAARSRTNVGT